MLCTAVPHCQGEPFQLRMKYVYVFLVEFTLQTSITNNRRSDIVTKFIFNTFILLTLYLQIGKLSILREKRIRDSIGN